MGCHAGAVSDLLHFGSLQQPLHALLTRAALLDPELAVRGLRALLHQHLGLPREQGPLRVDGFLHNIRADQLVLRGVEEETRHVGLGLRHEGLHLDPSGSVHPEWETGAVVPVPGCVVVRVEAPQERGQSLVLPGEAPPPMLWRILLGDVVQRVARGSEEDHAIPLGRFLLQLLDPLLLVLRGVKVLALRFAYVRSRRVALDDEGAEVLVQSRKALERSEAPTPKSDHILQEAEAVPAARVNHELRALWLQRPAQCPRNTHHLSLP
mmetsp:Transcript_128509/g.399900  ORF Transcript_128509/g.399900 Transcript_128509/m.399900 type:complete len:266 (+) Transcript_128509:148-945(+)